MVVNGLPMSILQVRGQGRPQEAVQRTELAWKESGYDTRRHVAGEWLVVSAASDRCVTTLQLVERGGAYGYLSVSQPDKGQPQPGKALQRLLPAGLTVESAIESRDQGRNGVTAVLGAERQSPQEVRDALLRRLQGQDWQALKAQRIRQPGMQADSERVTGQKGRQQLVVVIWRDTRTQAVLSLSEPP